jgi:serine/threonine-protein kinase RsbW
VKARKLTIRSRTEQLIAVREFVSDAARDFGFNDGEISKIALAVDEACTNIIKHGYKSNASKSLTITINPGSAAFEIVITDTGARFDPDDVETPDMKEYLAHYRKGGLGVYLMKTLMDKVEYRSSPGAKNEVRLIKYLTR